MGICTGNNMPFTNVPITIESSNPGLTTSSKVDSMLTSPVFQPRFHRPILRKLIRKRSNSFTISGKQTNNKQLI